MSCATAGAAASSASASSSGATTDMVSKLANLNKTISLIRNIKEERHETSSSLPVKSSIESIVDSINATVNKSVVNKRKPAAKKSTLQLLDDLNHQSQLINGDEMDVDDENIMDADDELEEGI